jgi:hypothetical protein
MLDDCCKRNTPDRLLPNKLAHYVVVAEPGGERPRMDGSGVRIWLKPLRGCGKESYRRTSC